MFSHVLIDNFVYFMKKKYARVKINFSFNT